MIKLYLVCALTFLILFTTMSIGCSATKQSSKNGMDVNIYCSKFFGDSDSYKKYMQRSNLHFIDYDVPEGTYPDDYMGEKKIDPCLECLKHFDKAKQLDLSFNCINDLQYLFPEDAEHQLNTLVVNSNCISSLEIILKKHDNEKILNELTSFYASNNQIESIIDYERINDDEMESNSKLNLLDLSFNNIHDINGLKQLMDLEKLYLNSNCIRRFDHLSSLDNLRELYLQQNRIRKLPNIKKNEKWESNKLEVLDLSQNRIKKISSFGFDSYENLKNLKKLNLSHNKINDISSLENYHNLTDLNLSYNSITDLSGITALLKNICKENQGAEHNVRLNLSNNKIQNADEFFDYLRNYKEDSSECTICVNLSNNPVEVPKDIKDINSKNGCDGNER